MEVWNHPKNADLRQRRENPNVLYPGEVLFIPDTPSPSRDISAGTLNSYTAEVPLTQLSLKGPPRAVYVVSGFEPSLEGTSGDDGLIAFEVPVTQKELTVTYPELGIAYPIRVAHLNPVEEPSGLHARLDNLGYGRSPMADLVDMMMGLADPDEHRYQRAIEQFRMDHKPAEEGDSDKSLRDKLRALHGGV